MKKQIVSTFGDVKIAAPKKKSPSNYDGKYSGKSLNELSMAEKRRIEKLRLNGDTIPAVMEKTGASYNAVRHVSHAAGIKSTRFNGTGIDDSHIIEMHKQRIKQKDIAAKLCISVKTVSNVIKRNLNNE